MSHLISTHSKGGIERIGRYRSGRVACAATAAVLGAMLLLVLASAPTTRASPPPFRGLIFIDGDNSFTPSNGVTSGSGTQSDPYVIEDRVLDASSAHGILINNTTKYFIVRNCLIENGDHSFYGIYLDNVTNGKIENNICRNNWVGIYLENSSYNTLPGNTCESDTVGSAGINLNFSSYNILTNNTCKNNIVGIYISGGLSNGIETNTYNTLTGNTCENNRVGIELDSSYNTLTGNTCGNDMVGIDIWGLLLDNIEIGIHNTLTGNTCRNDSYGIGIDGSSYNTLSSNTCGDDNYGIYITTFFSTSGPNYSENNTITLNHLFNNATNAYDNGANHWDNNGMGNYWSDWQPGMVENGTTLTSSDGIRVDQPRPIAGGTNQDNDPLVLATTTTWAWVGVAIAIVVIVVVMALVLTRRK